MSVWSESKNILLKFAKLECAMSSYIWSFNNSLSKTRVNKQSEFVPDLKCVSVGDWLSARYLLETLDNNVIISCFDKIIKLFDERYIIKQIVKGANQEQLEFIVDILKTTQLKQLDENKNVIMKTRDKSYFDYLPNESIINICEFLTKSDMESFKLTSILMALNVFECMKRYQLNVLNE